jgi:Zn-dependent protease
MGGPISWLSESPEFFVIWIVAVLFTLTIHEFAHAAVAYLFGDDTAKQMGRLTLNPLPHIDILGFLMLLFIGFGWAKPVPVNPYNLRNAKKSSGLVAVAGPIVNLLAAIIFAIALKIVSPILGPSNLLVSFLIMTVFINVILAIFNLIPIPPLDGSKVLFSVLPDKYNDLKRRLSVNGPFILVAIILLDSFSPFSIFSWLFGWVFQLLPFIL